jgi:copper chaperone
VGRNLERTAYTIGSNQELHLTNRVMALKLHVPTLNSPEAAKDIKDTILTHEPDAKVEIDIAAKTVTVEAKASEETFKQAISATGHEVSGYL